jgi:ADP-heptose:LPS heptosyltransferase
MAMAYRKICLLRTGALGDVILTLPVVHNLCLTFPEAQIHLIGNPRLLALAREENIVIHDFGRAYWASLFADHTTLSSDLKHLFGNADLVISYLPDPDEILTRNLGRMCQGPVIFCPPKPPPHLHAIDHFLTPLRALRIPQTITEPRVRFCSNDIQFRDSGPPESIALLIHPGSGSSSKCWPPENFAAVADSLVRQTGCEVYLSTGPADGNLTHRVSQMMVEKSTVIPTCDLREFAARMTTCTVFIGNDSGPAHLAAAVGLPSVVLFGPTDPKIWAPRNASVCILQSPTQRMSSLPVSQVAQAITTLMVTRPTRT